jgi:glutamyl/glutaminyl-tRNA synthetase
LNPDRSKMSKRSGDVAVEDYRKKGILPEVLINFVALLGWHPSDDREIFSLSELVREFSLERVGKAGAVFDRTKLLWMNAEYLKAQSDEALFENVRHALADLIALNGEPRVEYALVVLRGGVTSYEDAVTRVREVFAPLPPADPEMAVLLDDETGRAVVQELETRLAALPAHLWLRFDELESAFKQCAQEAGQTRGLKGKNLWRTVRAALTGQPHGPELARLVGIWGRERVLAELKRSLATVIGHAPC